MDSIGVLVLIVPKRACSATPFFHKTFSMHTDPEQASGIWISLAFKQSRQERARITVFMASSGFTIAPLNR
jgi:hypothetical protein